MRRIVAPSISVINNENHETAFAPYILFCRNSWRMDTVAKTTSLLLLLLPFLSFSVAQNATHGGTGILNVGAILDLQSLVGKIARTSILMAMEDFYAVHRDYTTKLVLHIRDSNGDNIRAASEGTYQKL
jgi:hypothetical protein